MQDLDLLLTFWKNTAMHLSTLVSAIFRILQRYANYRICILEGWKLLNACLRTWREMYSLRGKLRIAMGTWILSFPMLVCHSYFPPLLWDKMLWLSELKVSTTQMLTLRTSASQQWRSIFMCAYISELWYTIGRSLLFRWMSWALLFYSRQFTNCSSKAPRRVLSQSAAPVVPLMEEQLSSQSVASRTVRQKQH